jgi:hypothetical protein
VGRGASAEGGSRRGAVPRMSDALGRGANGKGLAQETPASKGNGTTVCTAVCAPDAEGQLPTPAAETFSSGIKKFAWEEGEAARRED